MLTNQSEEPKVSFRKKYCTVSAAKSGFTCILNEYGIFVIFVLLFIVMASLSDVFMTKTNLINVGRQVSAEMITALGMTFVLIAGGIDLSVGSIVGLTGTLAAGLLYKNEMSLIMALPLALMAGSLVGLFNGIAVSKAKIPPFIVTLATLSIARGLSLLYTGGYPIYNLPQNFIYLGRGYILGVPVPILITLVIVAFAVILLGRSKFGRHVYAIGGNEEAARLSGIPVDRVKIMVYVLSGLAASITGILLSARLASGQPTLGQGLELDAIAATVLGGTSLFGGKGRLIGTVIGALFLGVLSNGLNLLGVSSFWQLILKGLVLLIAVVIYERGRSRKK